MSSILAGFFLGFSLILAIGAQNAFVLRQGLRREHVLAVCLICSVSDAILIAVGVAGFGALGQAVPWFADVMRWGGAAFLLAYGALALRNAWRGGARMDGAGAAETRLVRIVLTLLALTWLNPHVYLDTVVLIGSVSAQSESRLLFAIGAIVSSFVFFFALGFGARFAAPIFAQPRAWQWLDAGIGLVMWAIALKLIVM